MNAHTKWISNDIVDLLVDIDEENEINLDHELIECLKIVSLFGLLGLVIIINPINANAAIVERLKEVKFDGSNETITVTKLFETLDVPGKIVDHRPNAKKTKQMFLDNLSRFNVQLDVHKHVANPIYVFAQNKPVYTPVFSAPRISKNEMLELYKNQNNFQLQLEQKLLSEASSNRLLAIRAGFWGIIADKAGKVILGPTGRNTASLIFNKGKEILQERKEEKERQKSVYRWLVEIARMLGTSPLAISTVIVLFFQEYMKKLKSGQLGSPLNVLSRPRKSTPQKIWKFIKEHPYIFIIAIAIVLNRKVLSNFLLNEDYRVKIADQVFSSVKFSQEAIKSFAERASNNYERMVSEFNAVIQKNSFEKQKEVNVLMKKLDVVNKELTNAKVELADTKNLANNAAKELGQLQQYAENLYSKYSNCFESRDSLLNYFNRQSMPLSEIENAMSKTIPQLTHPDDMLLDKKKT